MSKFRRKKIENAHKQGQLNFNSTLVFTTIQCIVDQLIREYSLVMYVPNLKETDGRELQTLEQTLHPNEMKTLHSRAV